MAGGGWVAGGGWGWGWLVGGQGGGGRHTSASLISVRLPRGHGKFGEDLFVENSELVPIPLQNHIQTACNFDSTSQFGRQLG